MAKFDYLTPEEIRNAAKAEWATLESKQQVCEQVLEISIQRMHQCFKHNPEKPHNGLENCLNLLRHCGHNMAPHLFARVEFE